MRKALLSLFWMQWLISLPIQAAIPPTKGVPKKALAEELNAIRKRAIVLEKSISYGLRTQKEIEQSVKKIKLLMTLQKKERSLSQKRIVELNETIQELELRRGALKDKIDQMRLRVRKHLRVLDRVTSLDATLSQFKFGIIESERMTSPKRKVLSGLISQSLKELEAFRIDLADAYALERRIQDEKQQLAYLFQDMEEKQSILELNRQLQADVLKKKYQERLGQLEAYQKLKESESKVEELIKDFNARKELEKNIEAERALRLSLSKSLFEQQKGKLILPIAQGKIISPFGKAYDPETKLMVFKKGIEIASSPNQDVRAIFAGRVAYSGELPDYGRVTILDHGDHFFSLVANLGALTKKVGEVVSIGDLLGQTDATGRPVYFEIRQRNIPVNPLQWLSSSISLNR